ncbi:MAG: peroxidase-related enzyme [Deltaproteobacteria bacterium]|nr:peroxidase-related enzyme [Deltaproteobacteria bacterium]MBW2578450.1 peroxidase-related enzyme [Deltaproteobacteria bacterium]MBW2691291.1 peroxidase-related enzyme [Deltaproteobacteria bacterium]
MALFPSLPENPHLADVFRAFPERVKPLLAYHDALLRGESPLTVAERELIAAFVSGLNACDFCFGAHKLYARAFGIDESVIDALTADLETADVEPQLKPILRYIAKLKDLPPKLTTADAQAVYDAGWSERALFDAIEVAALFNFMNRIIEGTGVTFDYADFPVTEQEIKARRTRTYADFADIIGIDK